MQRLSHEWTEVGHTPDALTEILFPLTKTWKIYSTKAVISGNHHAAPGEKWVPGGGIEVLCNYEIFGPKTHKIFVREKMKNSEC